MKIKGITEEDFTNYKLPSMFVAFPYCNWKCCIECGQNICQNLPLAKEPIIDVEPQVIVDRYISNNISKAFVFGGLEPMDSFNDVVDLLKCIRVTNGIKDDVVIYTGYNLNEIEDKIAYLVLFENIIVKFGRFIPDQKDHFDEVLGINLASDNQYAERIS